MAVRDPLVDGELQAFDFLNELEKGVDPGTAMMMLQDPELEEVDRFLIEQGQAEGPYDPELADRAGRSAAALASLGDLLADLRYDAIEDRWAQDENTLLNFAFKNGHHYVEADRARRGVVPLPVPRNLVRRKVAKFEPWFRAQHGQLSQQMPQAGVSPETKAQEDRDAASYADELREWIVPQAYSFTQRSNNAMWMLLGGVCTAYVGVEWNPDPEYEQQTGLPHKPELEVVYHSPLEIWCDNSSGSVKGQRWMGRDLFVPEPEARAMYLDDEDQRKLMVESEVSDPRESGYFTLRQIQRFLGREDPWGNANLSASSGPVREEEDVILCEYWGRKGIVLQAAFLDGLEYLDAPRLTVEVLEADEHGRSSLVRFPNGLRVVMTPEGNILEIADNHTPKGALPFREFKLTQSAGYWSMAWATPLREINQALDWLVSMREQHTIRTADPVFLEPKEAQVDRRSTATGTSVRIRYKANRFNMKPEWANPPPMPSDIVQYMQELDKLWMEIGARHEVTQGTLPTRLSGVTVSLLQEADAAQLGYAGNELEEGHAEVLQMCLLHVQAFFPENDPRLLKLAGNTPFKLQAFMAADLEEMLDISVQPGSGIPKSASALKQTALELFQAGALVDPLTGMPDYRRVMKVFEFGTDDELYAEEELDRANAREIEDTILTLDPMMAAELLMIAQQFGELPPPFGPDMYDNHVVFERSHRMRLKQIKNEQRIHPLNKQLLELRWSLVVQGALPVLMQTQPDVAAAFLSPAPAEGGEGEAEPDGDEGGSDGES